jgi:hypothetical protein
MAYSCCDGGRVLAEQQTIYKMNTRKSNARTGHARIVCVECLELGEIAVERGDVLCADAPEGADLEDFACVKSK